VQQGDVTSDAAVLVTASPEDEKSHRGDHHGQAHEQLDVRSAFRLGRGLKGLDGLVCGVDRFLVDDVLGAAGSGPAGKPVAALRCDAILRCLLLPLWALLPDDGRVLAGAPKSRGRGLKWGATTPGDGRTGLPGHACGGSAN